MGHISVLGIWRILNSYIATRLLSLMRFTDNHGWKLHRQQVKFDAKVSLLFSLPLYILLLLKYMNNSFLSVLIKILIPLKKKKENVICDFSNDINNRFKVKIMLKDYCIGDSVEYISVEYAKSGRSACRTCK